MHNSQPETLSTCAKPLCDVREESLVSSAKLTEIQSRERLFYNEYAERRRGHEACFDPIAGAERRPWNSYWETLRFAQERFREDKRLLDFGCGWGEFTVVYAKLGYHVDAFDLSEGNLAAAQELAARYDLAKRIKFSQLTAEHLSYDDNSFDIVSGIDILHHVDIPAAIAECWRVLKPGGWAAFREPLRNPLFDSIRNTSMVRWMLPNEASLDRHITHDEEKLTSQDLETIKRQFPHMRVRRFQVASRLAAIVKSAEMSLERFDYALRRIPGYMSMAGSVILELQKQ